MTESVSIRDFLITISRLDEDRPKRSNKWYRTQKEHWIGWLFEYNGPGYYGRKNHAGRDAKFAYNHVVQPEMIVYLCEAAGVDKKLVSSAKAILKTDASLMQQSGQIRKLLPWELVAAALWPN